MVNIGLVTDIVNYWKKIPEKHVGAEIICTT